MSHHAHQTFVAPSLDDIARFFHGYAIEGLIAQGGMGAVYKARQKSLDRDVAIKILPRQFGDDPTFRASFEAEAKAMARLNHPNLISVYDFGEAGGLLYIIMEFVPGKSLFHSAHGIAIDPKEAGRIIAAVCEGLAHAHEHGILHRDIKPANILLTPKAEPKIGDFGLARPVGRQQHSGEAIFGTPHYTAPEVISHPNRVDTRADIFSVGVMLHELLTGKLPADDARAPSVISGCDPRFDTIIRRASHPVPDMRYPDAATMAKELQNLTEALSGPRLRAVATTPRRLTPPSHTTRHLGVSPRKPASSAPPVGAIVGVIVALIAIVGAAILLTRPPETPPTPKPSPAASTLPKPAPVPVAHQPRPSPGPRPAPKPKPQPEPEPERSHSNTADHDPDSEKTDTVPKIEPVPPPVEPIDAPKPTKTTADALAWLDDPARRVMREKARPILEQHQEALERNLDAFQRRIDRLIRRLDRAPRASIEDRCNEFFDDLRDKGCRIPPKEILLALAKGKDLETFARSAEEEHREALDKQNKIDADLATQLAALRDTYIKGIELQIQRYTQQNESVAADALQEEIDATREQEKRFERIMRGLPPEEPKPEKDDKDPNAADGAKDEADDKAKDAEDPDPAKKDADADADADN